MGSTGRRRRQVRGMPCARQCTTSSIARPAAGSDSPSTPATASTDSPTYSSPRSRSGVTTPHIERTDMSTTTTPETAAHTRAGVDIDEPVGVVTGAARTWLRTRRSDAAHRGPGRFRHDRKDTVARPGPPSTARRGRPGLRLERAGRRTPLQSDARRTVARGARWDRYPAAPVARPRHRLIWLAHIGLDRAMNYRLKYDTDSCHAPRKAVLPPPRFDGPKLSMSRTRCKGPANDPRCPAGPQPVTGTSRTHHVAVVRQRFRLAGTARSRSGQQFRMTNGPPGWSQRKPVLRA